ncbi:hypothetical protein [Streptomyces edwardsiae]|uniref:Lipoprotein n=1 Tax=Streptomyces edwardsiae TaxID=3075527 RepID=A0ABU2QHP3_9ACTN|nr:hypothetical protein [Streptomyces sp. DSM 41635]MDT0403384.1 hypothetical protein [Streptomyces sp. DSM 41635]
MTTPRPIVRSSRVLAVVLATGTLLTTAACSDADDSTSAGSETGAAAVAQTESPTSTDTSSPGPVLSETGARNALITAADLEGDWTQVDKPQQWRDSLLVGQVDVAAFLNGKSDAADCQQLIDSLYDETLLGTPSGASALNGFEQGDSRLLYQVAAYQQADLDKSMKSLQSLPDTCDQFTVTGGDNGDRTVQVVEMELPEEGDARQGMTVTVKGDSGGESVTLTLDVAVVRIGADAITVTNGGLGGAGHDATKAAVQQGTQRLKDVLAGGTPTPTPSGIE